MKFVTVRDLRGRSAEVWRELAVEHEMIVTSNIRHCSTDARHGIQVVSPRDFLEIIIGES